MSPRKPSSMEAKSLIAQRLQEFFDGENFVEIAKKVSLTDRQVANSLRGDTKPSLQLLEYVAEHGGDVNYILTGKRSGEMPPAEVGLSPGQRAVLDVVQKLLVSLLEIQSVVLADSRFAEKNGSGLRVVLESVEGLKRA